jgi:hypothetical protein
MQVLAEMDGDVDAAIEYMIADRLTVRADDAEGNPYVDNACNGKSSNCPDSWDTTNLFVSVLFYSTCVLAKMWGFIA